MFFSSVFCCIVGRLFAAVISFAVDDVERYFYPLKSINFCLPECMYVNFKNKKDGTQI